MIPVDRLSGQSRSAEGVDQQKGDLKEPSMQQDRGERPLCEDRLGNIHLRHKYGLESICFGNAVLPNI
jgi:hypothetical protein